MATSEWFPVKVGSTSHDVKYRIEVIQEHQNDISLTSAVTVKVICLTGDEWELGFVGSACVYVDGVFYSEGIDENDYIGRYERTLFEKTFVIPHGADGRKEELSIKSYIRATETLIGLGEVTTDENEFIVSLDPLEPAMISDELNTNGNNTIRYRVRVDQISVNSSAMTSKTRVRVLAYPNIFQPTLPTVSGLVEVYIEGSIYQGYFDTPIFVETGAEVFSKDIDIKHGTYDPRSLEVSALIEIPSHSVTSSLQGFTAVLSPCYVTATTPQLYTSERLVYYTITVKENSVNKESLLSSVTVTVRAWSESEFSYLFTGHLYCRIDGILYEVNLTKHPINDETSILFEKTLNIPHAADGLKTLSVSAWMYSMTGGITADEQGFNVDLTPIHVPSQPSLVTWPQTTQDVGCFGDTILIHMNRKRDIYTHKVFCTFGEMTIPINKDETITNNTRWEIPRIFMRQIPNATSGVGTISVDTYANSGKTLVGTRSVSFKANVPADIVPIINSVTFADSSGYLEKYGKYVQGMSDVEVDIDAHSMYMAEVKSYNTVIDGLKYVTDEFTVTDIASKGTVSVNTTVTDTRGRSTKATNTLSIYPYSVPKITDLKATRCDADGSPNSKGAYLKAVFSVSVTSLDGQNKVAYQIKYKKRKESSYTTIDLTEYVNRYTLTNAVCIFEAATTSSYDVELHIDDEINPVKKGVVGSSISVFWSKLKGIGLAIGKVAELEGVFDIAFKTRFGGGILQPVIPIGTDFDTLLIPNTYSGLKNTTDDGYLNCPIANATFVLEVLGAGDEGQIIQRVTACSKTAPEIYERHYSGGSWDEWVLKVPADYIVEQGTKDGWVYEKYKSGITKMWKSVTVPVTVGETTATVTVDYPFEFTKYPFIFAHGTTWFWENTKPLYTEVGLKTVKVFVYPRAEASGNDIGVNLMIISQAE